MTTNSLAIFSNLTMKLNKLNKLFMFRVESELQSRGIFEVNATQALMLINIGSEKATIAKTTNIGYYIGTNISYNINALLKKGYITKISSKDDKRSVYLSPSKKGIAIINIVKETLLFQHQSLTNEGVEDTFIINISNIIDKLQTILDNNVRI